MTYDFKFRGVFNNLDLLLTGAWFTIQISLISMALGLAIGVTLAIVKVEGPPVARRFIDGYVEIIRNTPFLVQCFLVFFGLPSLGVRLTAGQSAVIALTINLGAYATEIVRAGIQSIHRGQKEAGSSLGLSLPQVYRYVVLFPAIKNVFPALVSQFVLLLLGSSVVSQISAPELFYMGSFLDSRTFLSFEIFIVIAAIYLVLSIGLRGLLNTVYLLVFVRR